MRRKLEKEEDLEEEEDDDDGGKKSEELKKMKDELSKTKAEDEKLLSEPEMAKPKPVTKFNSSLMLEKLRSNALKVRRGPGTYTSYFVGAQYIRL